MTRKRKCITYLYNKKRSTRSCLEFHLFCTHSIPVNKPSPGKLMSGSSSLQSSWHKQCDLQCRLWSPDVLHSSTLEPVNHIYIQIHNFLVYGHLHCQQTDTIHTWIYHTYWMGIVCSLCFSRVHRACCGSHKDQSRYRSQKTWYTHFQSHRHLSDIHQFHKGNHPRSIHQDTHRYIYTYCWCTLQKDDIRIDSDLHTHWWVHRSHLNGCNPVDRSRYKSQQCSHKCQQSSCVFGNRRTHQCRNSLIHLQWSRPCRNNWVLHIEHTGDILNSLLQL